MLINQDFEEFFGLLNAHKVCYLLVGGYAVAFHGAPRYTGDIDIYYKRSPHNAKAILEALKDFGFGSLDLAETDFMTHGRVVQLGQPPNRIDLINLIDGVEFASAWRSRVKDAYGEKPVFYIGKVPLLRNKRAAGRTKDLLDLERLQSQKKKVR